MSPPTPDLHAMREELLRTKAGLEGDLMQVRNKIAEVDAKLDAIATLLGEERVFRKPGPPSVYSTRVIDYLMEHSPAKPLEILRWAQEENLWPTDRCRHNLYSLLSQLLRRGVLTKSKQGYSVKEGS